MPASFGRRRFGEALPHSLGARSDWSLRIAGVGQSRFAGRPRPAHATGTGLQRRNRLTVSARIGRRAACATRQCASRDIHFVILRYIHPGHAAGWSTSAAPPAWHGLARNHIERRTYGFVRQQLLRCLRRIKLRRQPKLGRKSLALPNDNHWLRARTGNAWSLRDRRDHAAVSPSLGCRLNRQRFAVMNKPSPGSLILKLAL
jgi:hypothetical protein